MITRTSTTTHYPRLDTNHTHTHTHLTTHTVQECVQRRRLLFSRQVSLAYFYLALCSGSAHHTCCWSSGEVCGVCVCVCVRVFLCMCVCVCVCVWAYSVFFATYTLHTTHYTLHYTLHTTHFTTHYTLHTTHYISLHRRCCGGLTSFQLSFCQHVGMSALTYTLLHEHMCVCFVSLFILWIRTYLLILTLTLTHSL
jgi:hypothetical protein